MHLSRLNAPKAWATNRKGRKWLTRVRPGPHKLTASLPLNALVKNIDNCNSREAKIILNKGLISVDNLVRKDPKFAIGLMDIIGVLTDKKWFRVLLDKKGRLTTKELHIKDIDEIEKYCKIIGKTVLRKGIAQVNLFDGRNLLVDAKKGREYKVGDTLVIGFSKEKGRTAIKKHLKLEKGALVYISTGKYVGNIGTISNFNVDVKNVALKIGADEENIVAPKDNLFAVDKNFD